MEYIRNVIYLNEYKEGKRQFIRPGFARLERRSSIWSLSVIPEETGIKWPVALYIVGERAGKCVAYCVGEMDIQNFIHEKLDAGAGWFIRELDAIQGILIGGPEHYLAGTCTGTDGEVSFEAVEQWEPQKGETAPEEIAAAKEDSIAESRSIAQSPGNEPEEEEPESAAAEDEEMIQEDRMEEEKEEQKNPFSGLQSMYPFEDDEMDWCYQIEPKDLGIFSTKEWHLASNSFLLQGYYNYRHLMFAHKNGKNYIGVPGQFHRREQYLASRFGFPQFKGTQRKRVTMGDFGYWMREFDV